MAGRSPNYNRKKTLADLISDTRKPKIIPDTAWYKVGDDQPYEIPFETAWNNADSENNGIPDVAFYLSEDGEVRFRGQIDFGDVGDIVFILPEEVRPQFYESWSCSVEGGGTANIGIYPNGEVIVESID